ncbi:asparagine synthase-related protein [Pseudaquidulcibacter saccharophilus]|uniref:asparagine synthase-related protein n=1 Tax=Pseudaquidulcibacter saccharophilus TaxID=2831900 RepID=UPI001EFF567E|nr:asparagine synthase-related protein [Pseudaquidulcibacter saccharophilus]
MSGVVGTYLKDKKQTNAVLNNLLEAQNYRAKDGNATIEIGKHGLGLAYTRRLPEDPQKPKIFSNDEIYLSCDARIDNRDELIAALKIKKNKISEGELFLQAYLKWGVDFVSHIVGDFSVIIVDTKQNCLYAFRDHLGLKPLFFRHDDNGFLVSSDLRSLIAPGKPFQDLGLSDVDPDQIYAFAQSLLIETQSVTFGNILRLDGGSYLCFSPKNGLQITKYWQLKRPPDVDETIDKTQKLKELFFQAVECRIRGAKPVASLVSGGLDSSSISACAAIIKERNSDAKLDTFSIVFDKTPQLSEREYIEALVNNGHFNPHFIAFDNYPSLEGVNDLISTSKKLVFAPGQAMNAIFYKKINEQGFDVILDGSGGDEVIAFGNVRLFELAKAKQWRKLWKTTKAASGLFAESRLEMFIPLFLRYSGFKGSYKLGRLYHKLINLFNKPVSVYFKKGYAFQKPIVHETPADSEQDSRVNYFNSQFFTIVTESLEFLAAKSGVELRMPFYDKRLIEFCVTLGAEESMDEEWTRLIMRNAMDGILPEKIQWRKTKLDFSVHINNGLKVHHAKEIEDILENNKMLENYLDTKLLRQELPKLFRGKKFKEHRLLQNIWKAVALSYFLDSFKAEGK